MAKKLTLEKLKIRSFVTIQLDSSIQTIKAGGLDSDGPPHTSTAGSGPIPCSVVECPTHNCDNTLDCGGGNPDPNYTNICGTGVGGSGTTTQITQ